MSESDMEASQYMMETMMETNPEYVGEVVEGLIDSNAKDLFTGENFDLQEKMFETVAQYSTEDDFGALTAMMEQGSEEFNKMAMETLMADPDPGLDPGFDPNDPNLQSDPNFPDAPAVMNLALFVMSDLAENNAEILESMAAYDEEQFNDFTNHAIENSSAEDAYELTNVMANVDDQMREMMFEEITTLQGPENNYLVAAVFEEMTATDATMMEGVNEEVQSAMFEQVVMATQDMMEEQAYDDDVAAQEEMAAMEAEMAAMETAELAAMEEMNSMMEELAVIQEMEMAAMEMAYVDEMAAMEDYMDEVA